MNEARPAPDQALRDIADYVTDYEIRNQGAYRMARLCLMDAIGCAVEALNLPECTRMLGPPVPGMRFERGARVPGTQLDLDPVSAAFNFATTIRWLDFNDALAAAQGGHPSDSIGAILAVADYLTRNCAPSRKNSLSLATAWENPKTSLPRAIARGREGSGAVGREGAITMREVLTAIVKCYEIHGVLSLENNLARLGFDYVILPKVAATAVVTHLLGGTRDQIVNAVSNAWADGVSLLTYRQGNNTGPRKSWAGGDAASRAVLLAFMAMKGEMGYPSVLTMRQFGFQDAILRGETLKVPRCYGDWVMESVIAFKFVPAGMQGQSAAECAYRLHPLVKDRLDDIASIEIKSHDRMMKIMNKTGPLTNPADRDHCAQYLVAVGLIQGHIGTQDFSDEFAADPRIDALRAKMATEEDPAYTRDFHDPSKRTNTHSLRIRFRDGSSLPEVKVEYPLGHPPLHGDAIPLLEAKFTRHMQTRFAPERVQSLLELFRNQERLEQMPVDDFMAALTANPSS